MTIPETIRLTHLRSGALVLAVILVSGCIGGFNGVGMDEQGMDRDTTLSAEVVAQAPANATVVDSTDDRIDDVRPIQEVLQKSVDDEEGYASVSLDGRDKDQVRDALDSLPYHEEGSGTGYYIRHDGEVVKLDILAEL